MPCQDCAGLRVELLSLKEYMGQWFGVLLKKVEKIEIQNSEIAQKVSRSDNSSAAAAAAAIQRQRLIRRKNENLYRNTSTPRLTTSAVNSRRSAMNTTQEPLPVETASRVEDHESPVVIPTESPIISASTGFTIPSSEPPRKSQKRQRIQNALPPQNPPISVAAPPAYPPDAESAISAAIGNVSSSAGFAPDFPDFNFDQSPSESSAARSQREPSHRSDRRRSGGPAATVTVSEGAPISGFGPSDGDAFSGIKVEGDESEISEVSGRIGKRGSDFAGANQPGPSTSSGFNNDDGNSFDSINSGTAGISAEVMAGEEMEDSMGQMSWNEGPNNASAAPFMDQSCVDQNPLILEGKHFYTCRLCNKKIGAANRNNRCNHMKTHLPVKAFQCAHCNFKSSRRDHVLKHRKKHKDLNVPCGEPIFLLELKKWREMKERVMIECFGPAPHHELK